MPTTHQTAVRLACHTPRHSPMNTWLDLVPWLYPWALWLHRTAVAISITLFVARGLGVAWHQAWPMSPRWRRTSVAIDVVLLCAGLALWTMLQIHPVQQPWLGVKLLLLGVYVVLGSYALKRGRTRRTRAVFLALAVLCVLTMVSIALTRHPLGGWTT